MVETILMVMFLAMLFGIQILITILFIVWVIACLPKDLSDGPTTFVSAWARFKELLLKIRSKF